MVTRKIYDLGDTLDYEYTHAGRYGAKGEKRKPRKKVTPAQVMYQNRMNKAKEIRRLIKKNFGTEDWFLTLTWGRDKPANMRMAYKQLKKFLDQMRQEYRKRGNELKYIYVIEIGARGGVHVHLVINNTKGFHKLLRKCWPHGHPNTKNLYEDGDFRQLAEYMSGMPKRKKGKNILEEIGPLDKTRYKYNRSRNLEVVKSEKKKYMRWTMRKVYRDLDELKATPGYYIDKDSIRRGTNPYTGLSYLYYSEHRIRGGDGQ